MAGITGAGGEQVQVVLRQHLLEQYGSSQLQRPAEAGPCREATLLEQADLYLLTAPRTGGVFTAFPFYEAVTGGPGAQEPDGRKHLRAFIKAAELLETLCVHLLQQPWRRDIRKLKTFTGAFVYHLRPVFSSSALHSVLASIGYLPDPDASQSEFRLMEDVDTDRVMLLGFELLLARLECYHLLKQLEEEDRGSPTHKLLKIFQRDPPTTTQREQLDEKKPRQEEEEEEEEEKSPVSAATEALLSSDAEPSDSFPKPKHRRIYSVDHSIIEMQRTYPDLAFRGRRLLTVPLHKSHRSVNVRGVQAADLLRRASRGHSKAPSSRDGCSEAETDSRDERRLRAVSSGARPPRAVSLHITLRAGAKVDEESPTPAQLQAGGRDTVEPGGVSTDEEQELQQLADRMGHLCVHENQQDCE